MSLPLQITVKKFQEIFPDDRITTRKTARFLAENDWQPKRLPYNV